MSTISATKSDAIAVFGGSGATGKALISSAVGKGLRARALERRYGSIDPGLPRIEVLQGSVLSAEDVLATLRGCGAAICVFGPRPPYADIFCKAATANIVSAMRQLGIQRLVCQTGALIGEYRANRTLPFQVMGDMSNRRWPQQAHDRKEQEQVVTHSGLAWTIVKPPRLTNGRAKGKWAAGPDVRVGMLSSIAREDLAAFLLAETLMPRYIGQAVFIRG